MDNKKPLSYHGMFRYPDEFWPCIMSEFADNGAEGIAISDSICLRVLNERGFLSHLKEMCNAHSLRILGVHGPWGPGWDITETDLERRPYLIQTHKSLLAIFGELGVPTYTIHPHAGFDANCRQDALLRNNALQALEELLPVAEKAGIVIAVENNFSPPCTAERIVDLIKYFDSPWLGANYDTGHAHILDPAPGKNFSDIAPLGLWKLYPQEFQQHQLENMLPYLVTCHIHDNNGLSDQHKLPGHGTIDWKRIMSLIATAPRLLEYQSEVSFLQNDIVSIRKLCETFSPEFLKP